MPELFNFSMPEMLCFFAVLVRYSVMIAVLPITGDKFVPTPAKVLLALATTIALFPGLLHRGYVRPTDAVIWGATAGGIMGTIGLEIIFGLLMGFTAKLAFDSIHFGANLTGNFMGFAAANTYDPHQESQTQVVAEIQMAIATLLFLTLDGHHLMLRAGLNSYAVVGVGKLNFTALFSQRLVEITGQVIKFGIQIAAPVAISMFAVNIAFGVMAKALPQMNILVLSFAVSALVGLVVLFLSIPEFQSVSAGILGKIEDWMEGMKLAVASS